MNEDHQHYRPPRRMRLVGALVGSAMLAAASPAFANDLAGPELWGGFAQNAKIVQLGEFNVASLSQHDLGQYARVVQDGFGNQVDGWQGNGHGNHLRVGQHGHYNSAMVSQEGSNHLVTLEQHGEANVANIAQYGDGRTASIEQFGNHNRLDLVQGPASPHIALRQHGDNNVASLVQY